MSIENSYINAIISMVAKYHGVSSEGLLEAWNEMEQYKDVCYAKTADDIINALGWLADLYAVYGEKAGRVLRRVWICTECHHERRSLADYIERSFSQTDNPRSHYQVLKRIIWERKKKKRKISHVSHDLYSSASSAEHYG